MATTSNFLCTSFSHSWLSSFDIYPSKPNITSVNSAVPVELMAKVVTCLGLWAADDVGTSVLYGKLAIEVVGWLFFLIFHFLSHDICLVRPILDE